jgi:hypothetical protein
LQRALVFGAVFLQLGEADVAVDGGDNQPEHHAYWDGEGETDEQQAVRNFGLFE